MDKEFTYIPAKMDFAFKAIFGNEKNIGLLRNFLAAVLDRRRGEPI
jgi:hypothetical protein